MGNQQVCRYFYFLKTVLFCLLVLLGNKMRILVRCTKEKINRSFLVVAFVVYDSAAKPTSQDAMLYCQGEKKAQRRKRRGRSLRGKRIGQRKKGSTAQTNANSRNTRVTRSCFRTCSPMLIIVCLEGQVSPDRSSRSRFLV